MNYSARGPEHILYCDDCNEPLRMMDRRGIYCPKCKVSDSGRSPKFIMSCVDCNKPLQVTEGGGLYCEHCLFYPSLQDVALEEC